MNFFCAIYFFEIMQFLCMCVSLYTQCASCKYVHFISPTKAKCKKYIFLENPIEIKYPNNEYCENNLYLDVEYVRNNELLCGKNASKYIRRLI